MATRVQTLLKRGLNASLSKRGITLVTSAKVQFLAECEFSPDMLDATDLAASQSSHRRWWVKRADFAKLNIAEQSILTQKEQPTVAWRVLEIEDDPNRAATILTCERYT